MKNRQELQKKTRQLSEALCTIASEEQMREFLQDLCTPMELESMADRWRIVTLLQEGMSYREIAQKLETSTATISRVARSLKYGEGYQAVFQNINKKSVQ